MGLSIRIRRKLKRTRKSIIIKMIIDKIKTYLNSRSDIKYEELPIVLDKSNISELVERHSIRVFAPIYKNDVLPLHYFHEMEDFVSRFYADLKTKTGIENLKLSISANDNTTACLPKIVYKNGSKQTDITIKFGGKEFEEKGIYNKELDIEFY